MLHVERLLHIDPELTLDRWLAAHHTLGLILSDYYDNAHFVVTLGVLGWLWWRRADLYRPLRNSLVLVNVLGFVVFWRFPVAPPRMLDGFTDVVASTHAFGSWHTGALASHANQVAAMPSLHMAWAAWCTLALWRASERPVVRVLAVAYPCLTALAVLATGNHFLLLDDRRGASRRSRSPWWLVGSPERAGTGALARARPGLAPGVARKPCQCGVADVTKLLRSPRPGRVAGPPQTSERRLGRRLRGASTGPPQTGVRTFSSGL